MKSLKAIMRTIFLGLLASAFSGCGTDGLTSADSPGKTMTLYLYTKRIGDKNTYLALEEKKTGKEAKILKIAGIVPVAMTWRNDKEVVVTVPKEQNVEFFRESAMGVMFDFCRE